MRPERLVKGTTARRSAPGARLSSHWIVSVCVNEVTIMVRTNLHWVVLGVTAFWVGCAVEVADGEGDDPSPVVLGCDPGTTNACACNDGTTGSQVCTAEALLAPCECAGQPMGPACNPGEMTVCACADGSTGAQSCRSDGVYEPCACMPPASTGGAPATGGASSSTGGTVTGGSGGTQDWPTGGTGGAGDPVGGTGGAVETGGTGGAVETGGTGGSSSTPVNEPIIPSPDGACPTFTSGTQVIKGLNTNILAGTPGATKGPLLFTWHGTGSSGSTALNFQLPSSVRNDISSQGGIVIAPNDNGQTRTGTSPNGVWYETSDLEYADHIVACAVQNHNVDPRRIYTTGCSAGGLMAGAMAVKRSRYVAAAAPNSGGITSTFGLSFQDASRIPAVMTMHGGSSDTVIINFQTTSHRLCDFVKPAGGFAVDCNHGGSHCGASTTLHERAWEFMKAHPFGTKPSPYAGGMPAAFPNYCLIR
jgi:poly(3-hydroxybutyrate) depolymerase